MFSSSYISIDADPNHLGHGYNLEHRHLDIIHHWLDSPLPWAELLHGVRHHERDQNPA